MISLQEKLIMEKEALESEERREAVQDSLQKTRELLRVEREKWEMERGALNLVGVTGGVA